MTVHIKRLPSARPGCACGPMPIFDSLVWMQQEVHEGRYQAVARPEGGGRSSSGGR
jgi:hypothetical protein